MSFICSPSPSQPTSLTQLPLSEPVNNSMDLDTFLNITHNNVDFAKASSLVKNNQATYIEAELLHQLN